MCGIGAIIGKGSSESELRKSLSKIEHRGKNLYEMRTLDGCVLGANRLAIVDRARGEQPLSNEDETIFAVQNGEIFNYAELKKLLTGKGHKFKTDCDTEVLVHLWEEFGPKLIDKIDSEMYSFFIYDSRKGEYFAARDRIGIKPLYYAYDDDKRLHLASEIKQLSQFGSIREIREFPAGNFLHNGKFTKYFEIKTSNKFRDKNKVKKELRILVENAVRKRVQTDLPIGVFLSGGVDSTLLMELASRFHHNVTAIILGTPGSSDFENAIRFCKERNYPYHAVYPNPDYEKELPELVYYLESYEPLIVRQSFANEIISQAAAELGLKIVLVGEGADEIFAGYNEFSHLSEKNVNKGCEMLLKSLAKGHNMRVDKTSMRHTIEVRSPFFDTELLEYALNIDGGLKIKREDHRTTIKAIWRELASDYLPRYIAYRFKAPFANGAGMDIGFNYKAEDGILAKISHAHVGTEELDSFKRAHPEYGFSTREEVFYFKLYEKYGYDKFKEERYRLVIKDNLIDLEDSSKGRRLLVAEFDKLALYFPVYLASKLGLFKKHGLNVDFIATGGDDKTYASLIQNSAQIGLADPMFAMIDNPFAVKGEIIGELVNAPPLYVVTFKPNLKINDPRELGECKAGAYRHWHIGTYEPFSTTNTITKTLLPKAHVSAIHHSKIEESLYEGDFDVAIVLAEQAYNLEKRGACITYSIKTKIPHFLFTGFTISQTLEKRYRSELPKFLQAVHDSMAYISKNKAEALKIFKAEFELEQPEKTFEDYLSVWERSLKIRKADWDTALYFWRTLYPRLLHDINPFFLEKKKEDLIFEEVSRGAYSKCRPYREFEMLNLFRHHIGESSPIPLVGFWGASDKKEINFFDEQSIEHLMCLAETVGQIYKPGLHFTAILADEHAKNNGYPKERYSKYLAEIKSMLESRGWTCVYLSELWQKHGLNEKIIGKELGRKPRGWWEKIKIGHRLVTQAEKHDHLRDKSHGAQLYYLMRKKEAKILEKEFPQSIYWAYSDESFQEIYPDIPTLYLYSTKKGVGTPPWFAY
ncbi:MAG: asparagine synthase-related protein [Candidatus Micrarchaeota archaeon]|nr:asparagine synthase-related protein [Candidatus Micrarchaeota archaeon]